MSTHTEQAYQAVLDDLAGGLSSEVACRPAGRPSKSTILRRVRSDPEFALDYSQALEARAESRVDKLMQINERLELGTIDPQSARCISDNLRWLAGKDNPARYSDKIRSEVSGPNNTPLIPDTKKIDDLEIAVWIAACLDKQARAIDAQPLIEHST